MILKKIKCIGIGPAMTPEGKRKTQVTFGHDLDPMKHSTPQGVPIHYDNEMIVFMDEDAFKAVKRKFIVGEEYNMTISDKGIEVK